MVRVSLSVALALLVVLAGCSVGKTATDPTPDLPRSSEATVTVTAVVDGDTIRIAYPNGTRDTVRLVGVDTPEVHVENDPTEFEGIPDTAAGEACLERAGHNATSFAKARLLGRTVDIATDPDLDRRGYYDRLLAYVVVDDRLFNYQLVATGRARVYESEFTRRDSFTAAEMRARETNRGLWQCVDTASAAIQSGPIGGRPRTAVLGLSFPGPTPHKG